MDYLTDMPIAPPPRQAPGAGEPEEAKYADDEDLFSSLKEEQKRQGGSPAARHPGLETSLPAFDVFTTGRDSFNAQAKLYRTPFDSPEPMLLGSDATAHDTLENAPAKATTVTAASGQPGPSARQRALSVDAYSPASIFFTHTHAPHTTTATSGEASQPKRKKSTPLRVDQPKTGIEGSTVPSSSSSVDLPVDPLASAVIPDLLSSRSFLERRASEPTLGARRAALAAAEREKARKMKQLSNQHQIDQANAGASARKSQQQLHIDVDDQLSVPAASDVNRGGPFQDVAGGAITPKALCTYGSGVCRFSAFANQLCATHLTAAKEPVTPTTAIRQVQTLWKRSAKVTAEHMLSLEWTFSKKGERYIVKLWEDPATLERTVLVNGKVTFRAHIQTSAEEANWRLSMVLGKSKSSAFEVLLGAWPHLSKGTPELIADEWSTIVPDVSAYDFELWIDGFPFTEAQQNWLSELGAAKEIQRAEWSEQLQESQGDREAKQQSLAGSQLEASLVPLSAGHQQHYDALEYIKSRWGRSLRMGKTRLGYPKATIEWRFTVGGTPHTLRLVHSQKSGKRTIYLDQRLVVQKKPGMLDGMLLKRSASERIQLAGAGGVPLEVRIQRMHYASSTSASVVRDDFVYELFLQSVPFARNMKTLTELAGGQTDVEARLAQRQAEKEKQTKREATRRRDPRIVDDSPEPPAAVEKA